MKSPIKWLHCCILLLPVISGYWPKTTYHGIKSTQKPTKSVKGNMDTSKPNPPLVQRMTVLNKKLAMIYEARNIEYVFPSVKERETARANNRYNPDVAFPVDADVYYPPGSNEPQIFVTIPRFGDGIPYSLGRLTKIQKPNGTQIEPFPSYSIHSSYGKDCDGLTSVYRMQIDPCGRMWLIDSGEINQIHLCPPQVAVLDIRSKRILSHYRLPEQVYKRNLSRIVNLLVDIDDLPPRGKCNKAFVYLADTTAKTIIVYDVVNQKSWFVDNKYTHSDAKFRKHTIARESFQLEDGTFGLVVTPRDLGTRRMLYFNPLSHDVQAAVPLDVINNSTYFIKNPKSSLDKFIEVGRRGVQCGTPVMSPQGYLMCTLFEPIALMGWDMRKPYTKMNRIILAENAETLQFVAGLKVRLNPKGKYDVWMLSNRAQRFFAGTMNFNQTNYRIMKCGLDELLLGQACGQ